MFRFIFNLIAFVSFLLCVATVAVGLRSYWFRDTVFYTKDNASDGSQTHATLTSAYGDASLVFAQKTGTATRIFHILDGAEYPTTNWLEHVSRQYDDAMFRAIASNHPYAGLFMFDSARFTTPSGTEMLKMTIPLWVPVGIFAFLPMIARQRRRRSAPPGPPLRSQRANQWVANPN